MLDDELDLDASSESCELESIVSAGSFASDDYDLLDDDIYSDESAPPASGEQRRSPEGTETCTMTPDTGAQTS